MSWIKIKIVRGLEAACVATHVGHKINVPMSWFEDHKYATWRGRLCNALYGCPLTVAADNLATKWDLDPDKVWPGDGALPVYANWQFWDDVMLPHAGAIEAAYGLNAAILNLVGLSMRSKGLYDA